MPYIAFTSLKKHAIGPERGSFCADGGIEPVPIGDDFSDAEGAEKQAEHLHKQIDKALRSARTYFKVMAAKKAKAQAKSAGPKS
jgi:hypothetical protein